MKIFSLIFIVSFIITYKTLPVEIFWFEKVHDSQINKVLFNMNESMIISCGSDKKIILTDSKTGENINEFTFDYNVYDIALMNDENSILVCTKHRTNSNAFIYDMQNDSFKVKLDLKILFNENPNIQNQEFVEVHAVTIDENRVLTGIGLYQYEDANHYYTGRLDLWNIKTGEWIAEVFTGGMIYNLSRSPDGKKIAFSTLSRTSEYVSPWVYNETEETKLYVTDTSFSEFILLRQDYDENMEYADSEVINDIAFSNDSKYIALSTDNHHLFVYDIEKNVLKDSIFSCDCYTDQSVGFVFDGKHIISGTHNGKVYFWNLEYTIGIDSHTYQGNHPITSIATSVKDNLYVIADVKGNISLITTWYISDVSEELKRKHADYQIIKTSNSIELIFKNEGNIDCVEIYDMLGRPIFELKDRYYGTTIKYFTESLNTGLYLIKVIFNNQIITEKYIKSY